MGQFSWQGYALQTEKRERKKSSLLTKLQTFDLMKICDGNV